MKKYHVGKKIHTTKSGEFVLHQLYSQKKNPNRNSIVSAFIQSQSQSQSQKHIISIDIESDRENHELDNLPADDNFELKNEGEMEEKIEGFGNNNDNIETIKKLENKERKNSENENQNNNKILNEEKNKNDSKKSKIDFKKNYNFFRYNPNEEDKEIHKYSANILVPEEINKILGI